MAPCLASSPGWGFATKGDPSISVLWDEFGGLGCCGFRAPSEL